MFVYCWYSVVAAGKQILFQRHVFVGMVTARTIAVRTGAVSAHLIFIRKIA